MKPILRGEKEKIREEVVVYEEYPEYRNIKADLFRRLEKWFEAYTLEKYDGRKFPVRGDGQMERLEKYGTETTVFKSF